jgi:integrase
LEAGRTKNSRGHDIPLSVAAQAVLGALPRVDGDPGLVFTTTGKTAISGYSNAKERLDEIVRTLALMDGKPAPAPWRFHDLRRTVATGLARLGQPVHVVEAILNHRSGTISGVAAIYNRHSYAEEKRQALEAWGQFVTTLADEARPPVDAPS